MDAYEADEILSQALDLVEDVENDTIFITQSTFQNNEVSGFSLTGCYWNDDGTTLPVSLTSTSSTVECIEACIASNSGYIYAGTQQSPAKCSCGLALHATALNRLFPDNTLCNVPCPLLPTDLCGGSNRLAVYNITGETIPVTLGNLETTSDAMVTTETTVSLSTTERTTEQQTTLTVTSSYNTTTDKSTYISTQYQETFTHSTGTSTKMDTITDLSSGLETTSHLTDMVSTRQYSTQTSEWTISTTVNTLSSTNTTNCCICGKWSGKDLSNLTRNELLNILHDDLEEVHNNIAVDIKTTSSYKNKRISAPDNRTTSAMIGYLGGTLICVPLVVMIGSDIMRFCT